MVDDFEPDTSEGLDLQRVLGVVRRRHLHFLIPLLFGWAAIWGASWIIPPRYRSTTLILVEQPTMPKDYVTPNVNDDLQERLQSITQQILSRTRLLHIIEQSKLFAGDHAEQSPEAEVESMRKNIQIDLVQDSRNQISAFNLSFVSADPHTAQQVTSELTQMFINENLEVRQKASRGTTEFLEAQLEAAQTSLAKQEDKIREFKAQHVGEMPGQLASNLQVLSGVQSQLQNEEDALNTTKQQHVYLQSLADQYRAMEGISKGADGSEVGIAALDRELEHLRAQLADLSTRYTDTHPDVGRLKGQIAKTQKMRDDFVANRVYGQLRAVIQVLHHLVCCRIIGRQGTRELDERSLAAHVDRRRLVVGGDENGPAEDANVATLCGRRQRRVDVEAREVRRMQDHIGQPGADLRTVDHRLG